MSIKATGSKITARERARAARLRIDAEREARDRAIEEAAAGFFESSDRRDALAAELTAVERDMGERLDALAELGENAKRIGELLELPAPEQRRLRALTTVTPGADDAS